MSLEAGLDVGSAFAGCRVEQLAGRGGMGVVYRATDLRLQRPVALKLIAPELAEDRAFRERFLAESLLAASLDHPNVVPIYEAGEHKAQLFIAMRYVDGSDLKRLLETEGRLKPERAVTLCGQVAAALDAAHSRNLVHGDVKPGNVLLDGAEHVYLADFGLARILGRPLPGGAAAGTLDYLAPEQVRGEAIDGRTDQYALACCLFQCLTGRPPFRRSSAAELLWAHLHEPAPAVRDCPNLGPVLARALAKEKDERYPTCTDFLEASRAALGFETVQLRRHRRLVRRSRVLLGVGALILATGLGVAVDKLTSSSNISRAGSPSAPAAGPAAIPLRPNAVSLIDARSHAVVSRVELGRRTPSDIAFSRRSAWLLLADEQLVERVDLESRRITGRAKVPFVPARMATDGESVWVTEQGGPHVARIGAEAGATLRVLDQFSVPTRGERISDPSGIAVGAGSLWIARGPNLARVDPQTGRVEKLYPTPVTSNWVVFQNGSVWAASADSGRVYKIDPGTSQVTSVILRGWISDLAVGGGFVWVPVVPSDTVFKLSLDDLSVQGQIAGGADPESLAVGGGSLWIAGARGDTLIRSDIGAGTRKVFRLASAPMIVRYRNGLVWTASVPALPRLPPVPGGQEIRIPLSQDISLEPALPANADRWQRDYSTCATLLNYPDSAGARGRQLRPEIAAAMPAVSTDGRTYTFRVRSGFRFSPPSGQPVTAETFRYTLERAFSPKFGDSSPAMQLLSSIAGAAAYHKGEAKHISGISVRGSSLTIRLDAPDGAFDHRLALAFFCPVPLGTPAVTGGLDRPIPSAGPYYVASSALGRTVLLRNPYYHGSRPRRIERIVYTSGTPTAKAVALVDGGAADYIDGYTSDSDPLALATSSAAARHRGRYSIVPVPAVDAIAFNTRRPLFRDARERRAVNFAIDRRALAGVFDEQPVDGYIPPAIPGFRADHVYPLVGPDLAQARRLAGPGHHRAVLYSCGPPVNVTPDVEEIVRANLARIGIEVQIEKSLGCISGAETKKLAAADMALVSQFDDWGDPAGTISATLGLDPTSFNHGYWNDPALRRRIELAEALRGIARIREFARIDEILVRDAAPYAVYGAFTVPEYFSPRVGCKLFQATYHFVDLGALCIR